MKLMIVESPGKIEKLSEYLGSDWTVAASVGHISDLPDKEMGVKPPHFKPQYLMTERGATVVARLKRLAAQAEMVVLATDPDREGEAISWHLEQCLGLVDPVRVTFSKITQQAVNAALAAPRRIDTKLVAAQEARRVLDRLVGYMVSPVLSLYRGMTLSAGRVQSVAVRLVVDRDRERERFKPTKHFGAILTFAGAKLEEQESKHWVAEWQTIPDFASEESPYVMDKGLAQLVADVGSVEVKSFVEAVQRRAPPPPFMTITLQQAASVALDMDPNATMEAAQHLYEKGHISYHRTDSQNVSIESLGAIFAVATAMGLEMADEPRTFKAAKAAQEGHPAITPTHWEVAAAGETPAERALYKLIRIRAIACQLADAQYATRTAVLTAANQWDGKTLTFKAKGRTLVDAGWRKLLDSDQTQEEGDEPDSDNAIPNLTVGQVLNVDFGEVVEKTTKAPGRYTQASLIGKLESEGIGRPATYAAIMENIMARNYIEPDGGAKGKFLRSTPKGALVVDFLVGQFNFMELPFTRMAEEDLDRIAKGDASYKPVITAVYNALEGELADLQNTVKAKYPCPECGKPLRRIAGSKGFFWACSGHPECSTTLPDQGGEPGQKRVVELSAYKCPKCGSALIHHVKPGLKGYNFWGCSGFKAGCEARFPNVQDAPKLHA